MWLLFKGSFEHNLTDVFGLPRSVARDVMARAKRRYRDIIERLPQFEEEDRFAANIVSCALLSAVVLSMPQRPSVDQLTVYYRQAMMTPPMRWFCRMSAKNKYTEKDIASMRATAALKAADRNPYSWNMDFIPYPDGSGYEARFTACGICTLMRELGLFDLVTAMCALDYTMSEAGGATRFERTHTLADGSPYCDCGYHKASQE